MSTNFPTSIDNLNNPSAANSLNTPGVIHHEQHANANDAIEALEAKVGVNGSAVTSSLDYKVAQLQVKSVATDTIWNADGDIIRATANDTASRLAIGTNGQVLTVDTGLSGKLKWATPSAGAGGGAKYFDYLVAASNADADVIASADYVCDGTADQVQINAALAALPSTGGAIKLSAGTFNISSSILVQQDSAFIQGSGIGGRNAAAQPGRGTFLKGATGLTTALILVQNAANNIPVHAVVIRDLRIDGNAIGTAVDGIVFKSNQGLLENVYVSNCTGDGIQLEAYSGWELYDTRVVGCISSHNTGCGLFLNTYAADTRVLDCTLYTNTGPGLKVKAGGCQAVGGQYYNNEYGLIFDGGGSWFMASDIKIENSAKEGIYFSAATTGMEYVNIVGCTFRYNGKGTDDTYSHISGTGNQQCSNVNISGCRFSGRPNLNPDNKARYAIDMWNSNGALYWGVLGNLFAQPTANHFRQGAVRNNGLHCKVRGNQGCPNSGLMGTGAITAAATSVTITHNLPYTPVAGEIQITPTNNPTNTVGNFWVDTITSTQFNVNVENVPGASTWTFSYQIT